MCIRDSALSSALHDWWKKWRSHRKRTSPGLLLAAANQKQEATPRGGPCGLVIRMRMGRAGPFPRGCGSLAQNLGCRGHSEKGGPTYPCTKRPRSRTFPPCGPLQNWAGDIQEDPRHPG
eukprot:7838468-Pyramimonas_sp.AAC.1